jgi:hypothetical protein
VNTKLNIVAGGWVLVAVLLGGCVAQPSVSLEMEDSAVEVRGYQSRTYEGVALTTVMHAMVSTLQDLGFVIKMGDARLGLVSASRFERGGLGVAGGELLLTATVRETSPENVEVRVNARLGMQPIEDPEPYRDFFAAVSQAVFLEHRAVPAKVGG